jgi:hypothetical protein
MGPGICQEFIHRIPERQGLVFSRVPKRTGRLEKLTKAALFFEKKTKKRIGKTPVRNDNLDLCQNFWKLGNRD